VLHPQTAKHNGVSQLLAQTSLQAKATPSSPKYTNNFILTLYILYQNVNYLVKIEIERQLAQQMARQLAGALKKVPHDPHL